MRQPKAAATTLLAILLLFFLQSLSDFIQSIYAFGLLVTAFTIQIAAIVLLFTPLLLLFSRKPLPRPALLGLIGISLAARLVEPNLAPGGRLVVSGIAVGAFMLLFPALLTREPRPRGWGAAAGLALALMLSIALRSAGSSLDISDGGRFQWISWGLAIVAAGLALKAEFAPGKPDPRKAAASTGRVAGLCVGLAFVILMIYFAFASPGIFARWTGFSYLLILAELGAVWTLFAGLISIERFAWMLNRGIVWGWNALFVLALVLTILPHQAALPPVPGAYPLEAPAVPPLALLPLLVMLALSPVLLVDLLLFVRQLAADRPTARQMGGGFSLAALAFLVMIFFHVFTTVYDYAPVIGPLFRDRFWLVYLLAGLGMALPLALVRGGTFELGRPGVPQPLTFTGVGGLAVLSVVFAIVNTLPQTAPAGTGGLRLMTYNIHQGFDAAGNANLPAQLAVIRQVDPDILGLQESDTARIANGNVDAVRYFADALGMYSYYGPTTTTGTFGIALLSKHPIEDARTFFMYSSGEQTATIQARILTRARAYNIFVTHLGNKGPIVQLENILARLQGLDPVILMGDHNFRPDTDQYRLITGRLADSWLLKWPGGTDIPGYAADRRIDYIFVTPGMKVLDSTYVVDPASDHPYVYSVIQP